MTDEEKELIVKLVANGKNTFKELRDVAPDEWRWNILGHSSRGGYQHDVIKLDRNMEYIDALNYKPIDSDTFHLTDAGKNLLHRLNRENLLIHKQEEAIKWSKRATLSTIVIGVLSITLSVVIFLLTH